MERGRQHVVRVAPELLNTRPCAKEKLQKMGEDSNNSEEVSVPDPASSFQVVHLQPQMYEMALNWRNTLRGYFDCLDPAKF